MNHFLTRVKMKEQSAETYSEIKKKNVFTHSHITAVVQTHKR